MSTTAAMRTSVSQLYVAMFGRAPDAAGLDFWTGLLGAGQSVTQVADTMFGVAPARNYFPDGSSNEQIIASFYLNVLGRTADAEGLAFWTAKLNTAGATPGSVIAEMVDVIAQYTGTNAAGIASANLFNNRAEAAQFYGENGGSLVHATAVLAGVTASDSTVLAARHLLDPLAMGPVDAGGYTEITFGGLMGNVALTNVAEGATLRVNLGSADYTIDVQLRDGSGTDNELTVYLPSAQYNLTHLNLEGVEHLHLHGSTGPGWHGEIVYLNDVHFKTVTLQSGIGSFSFAESNIDYVDAAGVGGGLDVWLKAGQRAVGGAEDDKLWAIGTGGRLEGGEGNDELTAKGAVILLGGPGADRFEIRPDTTRSFSGVQDFLSGTDILSIWELVTKSAIGLEGPLDEATWNPERIALSANATLDAYLNAAAAKQAGADATAALSWFRFGGSSYIVVDNSEEATFQTGVDHAIKLVGYSDLSKFNYDAEMEAFV